MEGFITPAVLICFYAGNAECYHAVRRQRKGQGIAVHVNNIIYHQPSLYFLDISFGENNVEFIHKHISIIVKDLFEYKIIQQLYKRIDVQKKKSTIYNFFFISRLTVYFNQEIMMLWEKVVQIGEKWNEFADRGK